MCFLHFIMAGEDISIANFLTCISKWQCNTFFLIACSPSIYYPNILYLSMSYFNIVLILHFVANVTYMIKDVWNEVALYFIQNSQKKKAFDTNNEEYGTLKNKMNHEIK